MKLDQKGHCRPPFLGRVLIHTTSWRLVPPGLSAACVAGDSGNTRALATSPLASSVPDAQHQLVASTGSTLRPQPFLWTLESAQLIICPSSCLSADLNPPASATHPSACFSLSTSCPCLPGVCHSAHQTHGLPPNPGLLLLQHTSDQKKKKRWNETFVVVTITACLSRAQTVPWLPAPSSFP